MPDFSQRNDIEEWMDDLEMDGPEFDKTLTQLGRVNYWLGGQKILCEGVAALLKDSQVGEEGRAITVVDLGCGGGDGLRKLAKWAQKKELPMELLGVDANLACVNYGRKTSAAYANLKFEQVDCLSSDFLKREFDIVHVGLFLHHFQDDVILDLLPRLCQMARIGVVINDLQRHPLAYRLFQLACTVFRAAPMIRHDGLASILRSFSAQELRQLLPIDEQITVQMSWKWAFRFQILMNTEKYSQFANHE